MENGKEKPAEILVMEFRTQLVALVNNCGLPPFIVEMVISEVHNEISSIARAKYEEIIKSFEPEKEKK